MDPTRPAARDGEPVVMTGKDFAAWRAPSNVTAKARAEDRFQPPRQGGAQPDR